MFDPIDSASVKLVPSIGAIITRPLAPPEAERLRTTHLTQAIQLDVGLEWVRMELRRHESLWDVRVHFCEHFQPSPSPDDPLGQRDGRAEAAMMVNFQRLVDGQRKYMLTFENKAHEVASVEELIDQLKSLYARSQIEQ